MSKPKTGMPSGASGAGERIAKRLARAGLCSRREAERWIADGRVAVDGVVLTTPAVVVDRSARITVDGRPLGPVEPARLWRFHKPRGVICTRRDPEGRPTVFDRLPKPLAGVKLVGRLDLDSEGLLLLTNDGELARRLELPASGWLRRYRVRAYGEVAPERLAALAEGITVEGVHYGPIEARLETRKGRNAWYAVSFREGRNRELRRVFDHLGLSVGRLIRVGFGPFELGRLEPGAVSELPARSFAELVDAPPSPSPSPPARGRKHARSRR